MLGLKRARGCAVKERESHDASGPPLYQLSIDSSCMWAPLHNVTLGAVAMLINPQPCSHHATFLLVPSPPRDSLVLSIQGCTCCSVTDRQAQGRTTPRTQTRACCRMALSQSPSPRTPAHDPIFPTWTGVKYHAACRRKQGPQAEKRSRACYTERHHASRISLSPLLKPVAPRQARVHRLLSFALSIRRN